MDKIKVVADEILSGCVKNLSSEFIYLAYPLGRLNCQSKEFNDFTYTNGRGGYFSPRKVCEKTANGKINEVKTEILHMLLHCLFLHPFKKRSVPYSSVAYDITVGFLLDELEFPFGDRNAKIKRKSVYKSIFEQFGGVNDNATVAYLQTLTRDEIDGLKTIFTVCDHSAWEKDEQSQENGNGEMNLSVGEDLETDEQVAEGWASVARNLIPQIGKLNPSLKRILSVAVGGDGDYKAFLRSFIRKAERIKPSEEEFDYIYYCLGLNLYKNTPLIENLEYSDTRDFSEIAIAIDTSGSTDGEPIKRLLGEVFSVIKSMETGSKRYKIRIIQCDLKIQKEDVVNGSEEFAELMKAFRIEGGGGTDFRPVFERLIEVKKKGEKVEGLIYFTDGKGIYPTETPPFKTCFVILNDNEDVKVPHFAYKIKVEEGTI